MQRFRRSAAILVAAATPLLAQQKPTVTAAADLAKWETLGNGALSPDGKFVAYDFRRGNGTTELRWRDVGGEEHAVRSATGPQFTGNSRWLLFTITPDTAGRGAGRGRGGAPGGAPGGAAGATTTVNRSKVGIVDLRTGAQTTVDDIQSFALSSDGSHVALRRYGAPGRRGADVIVRALDSGSELAIGNVAELAWSDDGALLAIAIEAEGHAGNGVQLLDAATGTLRVLDASAGTYAGLAWRSHADDLAAMRGHVDSAFVDTAYTLLAWRGVHAGRPAPVSIDAAAADPAHGVRAAAYRPPQWSDDGSTIFFGVAPREPKVTVARAGETPARVQVWHWKDVREFHQQEVNAAQDRQRTTLAAWHPGQATFARLGDDPYENVQVAGGGGVVVAMDQSPYAAEYMSGRAVDDVYLVDPSTGRRTKVLAKSPFGVTLSPSGRVALYQQNGQWWALDVASNARTNLTGRIGSSFVNMEDDHPVPERRAYGVAGFVAGEKAAILYDRFDLWLVNLDGSSPTRLTRGREDAVVYRCAAEPGAGFGGGGRGGRGGAAASPCALDGEGRTIDTSKPLILSATGEYDKRSGYASVVVGQPVQRLVWQDAQISGLRKAKDADVYLFEKQSYADSPNYFVAGPSLADARAVSSTNAFQGDYAWGRQVLMDYTNRRGDKLQMMLTYPADYVPGRKYPMVVYYYEKLSQGFHQYVPPSERSPYSTQNFSQNGYFVLRPDIVFQARNPGFSGLDCVESAVHTALSKVADIDAKRVGNMGHSWGGYQSAFYAVHNHDTFAATIAGAPLTDLISFYGYTSGNSGLPESGHFETSQERMQVSLWEDPQAYIRNSTVFAMDSLKIPLLLEEGDADGNVNPFQSQEVYNFGRRLGKTVVYLVYEGENHNVARPESQADYTRRQLEWFGHWLKGEPAATWITGGETYAERQRLLKAAPDAAPLQAGAPTGRP